MDIIVVGCGRFGSTLASELSDAGHNVSVVDRDETKLNLLGSGFNGVKVKGIEYDESVLNEAGIGQADAIFCVTPDENINITVSLIAKEIYKVSQIVARIVNPSSQYIYEELNIDTINPIQLGAGILKAKLSADKAETIITLNQEYEVAEVSITKGKQHSVGELEEHYACVVSAIIKKDDFIFPSKNEIVKPGEVIVCTISKANLDRMASEE